MRKTIKKVVVLEPQQNQKGIRIINTAIKITMNGKNFIALPLIFIASSGFLASTSLIINTDEARLYKNNVYTPIMILRLIAYSSSLFIASFIFGNVIRVD